MTDRLEEIKQRNKNPWLTEPNFALWEDAATGLLCCIKRHPVWLHLNGYVRVLPGHPLFGQEHNDIDQDVHGGITYSGPLNATPFPEADPSTEGWWFGFDTGHAQDYQPGLRTYAPRGTYRTFDYVTLECTGLAHQLHQP